MSTYLIRVVIMKMITFQWSDLLLFISIFNCDISSELFHGVHLSERLNQGVFTFFSYKIEKHCTWMAKNGNACIKSHQIYLFP